MRTYAFILRNPPPTSGQPLSGCSASTARSWLSESRMKKSSLLCDFQNSILKSNSLFPLFMVVAFEAGGPLRTALLLLCFPLLLLLGEKSELGLRVMVFVSFCGLKTRDMEIVARAVLPKVYLEELNGQGYEAVAAAGRRVVATRLPRVMVEVFLKEYLGVNDVVAAELEVAGGRYFTGNFAAGCAGGGLESRLITLNALLGEDKVDVGLVGSKNPSDHYLISYSKQVYVLDGDGGKTKVPREKYPKPPLVFHDGRLAFLPTPAAALALLLWLPFAVLLSVLRILVGVLLPYRIIPTIAAALGVHFRVSGVLYVCTHRTLVDPIFLSYALGRSVPAVTYSLSHITEAISPIRTVRLTRDRRRDAETMRRLLASGDLAVCPEGTTCREPYLLRFSPLFAELAAEIEPVAINAEATMFYGTTASGLKFLDPIFFFMNPQPRYHVRFLGCVPREMTVAGGWQAAEVANRIQKQLAEALGFECTSLTRKDKYLVLAGNDGVVPPPAEKK
ncbi:Glycerol-3-phosphate acyltransferase 1 [Apostasia shenzhenica]|uniref:Glycerol-3-phosphate acyltransferase 1 n=1 Tax=Apostasia shenzhenica TaxID=1088818 RepID=A0A2H9ZV82_9ASPA|nr:Glycerol-3-phosphate acyltransferase 1 [Apostasia shenzhenica]